MRPRTNTWSPPRPPDTAAPMSNARAVQAEARLNLDRFAGEWHELARLPMPFQRHCDGESTMRYTPTPDGNGLSLLVSCRNRGRPTTTHALLRQPRPFDEPAQLEARFRPSWLGWLPGSWVDHWILALGDAYEWAIVGDPKRSYLWLLSRQPNMAREPFDELKSKARRMGFDLAPLFVSPHRAG